jgi:hypothetical protein
MRIEERIRFVAGLRDGFYELNSGDGIAPCVG